MPAFCIYALDCGTACVAEFIDGHLSNKHGIFTFTDGAEAAGECYCTENECTQSSSSGSGLGSAVFVVVLVLQIAIVIAIVAVIISFRICHLK